MITLQIISIIVVTHFLADFGIQTQEQAMLKSSDSKQLFYHASLYSLVWLFISFGILGTIWKPIIFAVVTLAAHFWTDFYTSRIVKKFFDKGDTHNAFVVIGGDQILHYAQLFLTYLILR